MRAFVALMAALAIAAVPLHGQSLPPAAAPAPTRLFDEALVTGLSLLHDNDGWPHPGNSFKDDNYSAGLEIRLTGRLAQASGLSRPLEGLDWLSGMRRLHARGTRRYHSVQAFGLAYTPDDLRSSEPQRDDRPFASLVGLAVRRTSVDDVTGEQAWSSEAAIGWLGLDLARELQTLLHRTRRWMTGNPTPVDPEGWRNQISDGGEPTALYRVGYQRRLAGHPSGDARKRWQVVGGLEGSAGYQTHAAAALSARAGAFTSDFWEFSSGMQSPGTGRQHTGARGAHRWELFAFALARPKIVAYNALLQGQFRDSVHTVRLKRLVGEWEGGVAGSLPLGAWHLQAVMQLAQGRTTEFVAPRARLYTWGTILMMVSRDVGRR